MERIVHSSVIPVRDVILSSDVQVEISGYDHLVPKETQAPSIGGIIDKGKGTAESPSHENYFSLRPVNEGTGPKLYNLFVGAQRKVVFKTRCGLVW